MKKNDGTMFRSILTLAMTAVMLLSGMLGISAQAAKKQACSGNSHRHLWRNLDR